MEGTNSMRVLVIEDSEVDFRLVERALGDEFAIVRAETLAAGLETAKRERFDLVILDLTLDDSRGYETFERARAVLLHTSILVLSGINDDALALRAVSNGAQDYIRKSNLLNCPLDRIAQYAIERRRFEEAARKSEQRYRDLFDNLPTAAYTCDAEGLITYYNEKAVELWGRAPKLNDPEDRFGGSFKLFTAAGAPIAHDQAWMARAIREGTGFNGRELIVGLPNGESRSVLVHANPVFDENGTITGGINVIIDISSQRRAERELRESERFARATVNSLSAHIAILDDTGTILAVNTAWAQFVAEKGMTSIGQGIGTNYLSMCDQSEGDQGHVERAVADGIRAVLRGERTDFCHEYPCYSPGEERWFLMRAAPFEGEGPTRVVLSREDITSRKTAERLASEQCGLRDAVAGMEQVLGVVGHELRTPLAALRAISEFLCTDGARDTAEADRFLHEISDEVDRMSDTVNNLLEAARLNSGRAKWNWSEVDVVRIIEESIVSIQPLIDAKGVGIEAHIDPSTRHALGDADAIRRLLINLLSNARKHTKQGKIQVSSRNVSDAKHAWIELAVNDTGCGIPPELSARLGEAFALNSGVVGGNYVSGTGLGLAICKQIAAAHGGALRIESSVGQGTTVTARLRADLEQAASGDTFRSSSYDEATA
jgi:PAS domain S-box-containing protein